MEINIKPEEIDEFVKNKILESSLGKMISETVAEFLKKDYSRPVERVLEEFIRETTLTCLREEYGETIKEGIRKLLEAEAQEDIIHASTFKIIKYLKKIVEDY